MSQKKEHKPCNKAQQSQSQKQSRSGKQISGESSLLDAGEYTMQRFAALYGFTYQGMATNEHQAVALAAKL